MVLTDPPYGTTDCSWDSIIPFRSLWPALEGVIKPNCMVVLFGKNPFTAKLIASNTKRYCYDYIWVKGNSVRHLSSNKMPMSQHELISVFRYGRGKYYAQCKMRNSQHRNKKIKGQVYSHRERPTNISGVYRGKNSIKVSPQTKQFPTDVLCFSVGKNTHRIHQTQKPTKLLEFLINSYSLPGETVLDYTMGSASTAIAAMATGRDFVGFELDREIFDKAKRRVELYQKQLVMLGKM